MDRRSFTQSAVATLAAAGLRAPPNGVSPIGIQLYTVRDLFAKDPEGTLAALKQAGYAEVEFAGYAGRSAAAVKAMLTGVGLAAPSAHVDLNTIRTRWPAALAFAAEVGHRYLVLASIGTEERQSLEQIRRLGDVLNHAATEAKAAGIRVAYHNHDFEFASVEGRLPYDVLLESTDPALVKLELDLYWATKGRVDPLAYFAKWPGRFPMVHIKDMDKGPSEAMVDLGTGRIDFKTSLGRRGGAGIEHYFIEHDEPRDPLAFARAAAGYLRALET